jgi:HSP20 family protein
MIFDLAQRENFWDSLFELADRINESATAPLKADLAETDTGYELYLDLPGMTTEQISINYNHQILTVAAENQSDQSNSKRWRLKERTGKRMSRSFYLPGINPDTIQATLKNGILAIQIQKRTEIQPKKISISTA